jgi:hypothetical protein
MLFVEIYVRVGVDALEDQLQVRESLVLLRERDNGGEGDLSAGDPLEGLDVIAEEGIGNQLVLFQVEMDCRWHSHFQFLVEH